MFAFVSQAAIVVPALRFTEVSAALSPHVAVDTDEVLQRIQASLLPWHRQAPATIARIHLRPDLTGPAYCLLTVLVISALVHRGEWSGAYTVNEWRLLQLAHLAQGVAVLGLYAGIMSGAVWVARGGGEVAGAFQCSVPPPCKQCAWRCGGRLQCCRCF
jgi:hypothetical protein